LYIANFTANQIDVMSTATNTIQTSINVAAQPGSLALSRDAQYLLVAHFNNSTPPVPSANLLTLIHLPDNTQQTFVPPATRLWAWRSSPPCRRTGRPISAVPAWRWW
jgi:DNA-binding beta-propeller fold protein YncE